MPKIGSDAFRLSRAPMTRQQAYARSLVYKAVNVHSEGSKMIPLTPVTPLARVEPINPIDSRTNAIMQQLQQFTGTAINIAGLREMGSIRDTGAAVRLLGAAATTGLGIASTGAGAAASAATKTLGGIMQMAGVASAAYTLGKQTSNRALAALGGITTGAAATTALGAAGIAIPGGGWLLTAASGIAAIIGSSARRKKKEELELKRQEAAAQLQRQIIGVYDKIAGGIDEINTLAEGAEDVIEADKGKMSTFSKSREDLETGINLTRAETQDKYDVIEKNRGIARRDYALQTFEARYAGELQQGLLRVAFGTSGFYSGGSEMFRYAGARSATLTKEAEIQRNEEAAMLSLDTQKRDAERALQREELSYQQGLRGIATQEDMLRLDIKNNRRSMGLAARQMDRLSKQMSSIEEDYEKAGKIAKGRKLGALGTYITSLGTRPEELTSRIEQLNALSQIGMPPDEKKPKKKPAVRSVTPTQPRRRRR